MVLGLIIALAALPVLAPGLAATARADTFWTRTSGGVIEVPQVTITGIAADHLEFRALAGNPSTRPLGSITRVRVNSEPLLNNGEEAFAAGRWAEATDNYDRVVRTSVTPWVKQWAAMRLMAAAQKAGRFDAAVAGYIATVQVDPTAARKPAPLPEPESSFIDTALRDLQNAVADQTLSVEQRRALLSLLMDLQRARGQQEAAAETIQQMIDLGALDPSDPDAAAQLARLKLDLVGVAIASGQYQRAIDEITQSRALFTDSFDQADALFALAEARYAMATKAPPGGEQAAADPTALRDAGLEYMRIVAHFKDLPGQPHVAEALLRTAQIHEELGEDATAAELYQQIVAEHADQPASTAARAALSRLRLNTASQPPPAD